MTHKVTLTILSSRAREGDGLAHPRAPRAPLLTPGPRVNADYLRSLDRTLNKPPAPVERDHGELSRQSAVYLSIYLESIEQTANRGTFRLASALADLAIPPEREQTLA